MTKFDKEVEAMLLAIDFKYQCFGCGADRFNIDTIGLLDNGTGWRIKCFCGTTFDVSTIEGDERYNLCLLFNEEESLHYMAKFDRTFFHPANAASIKDILSVSGIVCWKKFEKMKDFI